MKYALSILAALALPVLALAADPYIKTKVDGDRPRQPWSIDTRQGDTPTARIYTYIGGKKWVADTNWIPVLGWGTNGQYSTGLHSITGNADGVNNYAKFNIPLALTGTSGTFYASFSMTNRVDARRFTWPDGRFLLDRNPASGGNALAAISNILDFSLLTVLNRPYLISSDTSGWSVVSSGDIFTNWLAVSGSRLTLAGAGRSGSNTIGLTDAAIQGAATGAVHGSYLHVNSTAAWVIASITNALNDSVVALNAASNTFEADINALVAASNRPSLTQVSDVGNRHGDGLRGVELVAGGPDYAFMASNGTIRVRLADGANAAAGYFRGSTGTDIITIGENAGGSTFSNSSGYVDVLKNSVGLGNRVGTSAGLFQLGNVVGSTAIIATNTGGRIALGTATNPLTILAGDGLAFLPGGIDFGNAEAFAAKYTMANLVDGHVLTWDSGKSAWTNEAQSGGLPASATNVMVTFAMTNGWNVSAGGGGTLATSAQYTVTFRHADLAAGVLTVDHGLASTGQIVQVFRTQATGYDEIISPDAVSVSNMNTVLVDLTTFGSFAWTGRVTVAGSSVTAALGNYLQSAQTNGWDVSGGGDTTTNMYASVYFAGRYPTFAASTFARVDPDAEHSDIHNIYDPVVGAITPPYTNVWISLSIEACLDGASGVDNHGWVIQTNDAATGGVKYYKNIQDQGINGIAPLAASWFHKDSAISNYPLWFFHQYASTYSFVTGLNSQADSDTPFRMIVNITKEQP